MEGIVPELRAKTRFQRLNLMDNSYDVPKDFDVIFCRNVLIYFDRETQEKVISKLCYHLRKGGYFFLGHSGAGKTTVTSLSGNRLILGDDMNLISLDNNKFFGLVKNHFW